MTRRKRERKAKEEEASLSPGEITQREGARLVALMQKAQHDIFKYFVDRYLCEDPEMGRAELMKCPPFERASYILTVFGKSYDWRQVDDVYLSYKGDGWMGTMRFVGIDKRDEEFVVCALRYMVPSLVFIVSDREQRLECFRPRHPSEDVCDVVQAREHLSSILKDVSAF